ncbi:MAG: LPS assembly lipoprotein LptE [Bacteroidales bacterium]|jgi:outer membrane lipopolysaccharide assembly protein LptE/RlpB|nr:LPS assembly lipoprotein LptE [Bacteroidales bacterium]MCI2121188.1 LPS assembly lipoprotein LptE [Bacteroidales bacterium]MCI2145024.1 LPS assembly lipoprotein LptE [Bacteroidales bacterium]
MRRFISIAISLCALLGLSGCGIYSFSGTSIKPDVKTIYIEPIVNNALKINPTLANDLTEALHDKYKALTKLKEADEENADLLLSGEITSYDIKATAITANETAAKNRLTITVKIDFQNVKYPEENVKKDFVGYGDYDSSQSFDSVEATLCDEIVKTIVEDIFNATVAQW